MSLYHLIEIKSCTAEGLAEGKIVIARQMEADGMPADAIKHSFLISKRS